MSVSPENLGELRTLADVFRRAEMRVGGRSVLVRLTGISEQNLRRWGDQGEFPNFKTLYSRRRELPVEMLVDFVAVICDGTQVKPMVIDSDASEVVGGSIRLCSRSLLDHAMTIDRRFQDGVPENAAGLSTVMELTSEHMHICKQLAFKAMAGVVQNPGRNLR